MDWMNSREKKIFLTVFLLTGLFVQWYGVNANSRFDLTRSLVENHDFDITEYRNNTGDRSIYKGSYYSDKAPGLSLLAAPVYGGWRTVYSLVGNTSISDEPRKKLFSVGKAEITVPASPGDFYYSSLIIVVLFTSTLSVAALSILVYRISESVIESDNRRLLVTFAFAFGTLITHYGTGFLPAAPAALFSFLPFYLIYNWENHPGEKKMILAGLTGGFAVVLKSTTGVMLLANALYAYLKYRKLPLYFTLGGFIGGLPYMIYNTVNFGAPWRLPRNFLDPAIWPHLQRNSGFRLDPVRVLFVSLRMLFTPYRGIFYWFPFLLLSILGLKRFYRSDRDAAVVTVAVVLGSVLLASSWWAWWHGGWFGARLLVPIMPFLMLPLFYAADRLNWRIVVLLAGISITINLAGFHGSYEDRLKDLNETSKMKDQYRDDVKSLQPLYNPVKDYYLPGLLKKGPQSRLLNGLYRGELPADIRAYSSAERAPPLILYWLIALIPSIIWRKEILEKASEHRKSLIEEIER